VPRVGLDLVAVEAFRTRFEGRDALLAEVFTADELAYARSRRSPWPHLAARFAAKEAALKALRSGLTGAMSWNEVEVTRDAAGAPGLVLHGAVAAAARREGVPTAAVSLAHTAEQAMAVVLLSPA
jgi:holo-[acyl-carrier protein] synthase